MPAVTTIALTTLAVAAVAGTVVGAVQGGKANDLAEQGMNMTNEQVEQQLALQAQAQA